MVLSMPTLMLNRNWTPIRVTTVADALTKMFEGVAKAVDEEYATYDFDSWAELRVAENEPRIRTGHLELKVPDVIVLGTYGDVPDRKLAFSRANIYKRDRYTCQYCGKQGMQDLTIDHILPRSRGGVSSWSNCVLACWECNAKKADRTPSEAGLKLRVTPIKPHWHPRLVLARIRTAPKSWEKFVNDAYWNVELKE